MKTTPRPRDGEVHLYALALPHCATELARLGSLLAPGETERARLLKSGQAAGRYLAGRGLLREILGGYLGVEARVVQLATGEHGKPFLTGHTEGLHFNLAHSGDAFLLAVAANREVGIDIEAVDPDRPLADMARMVFSRHEQEQLSGLLSPRLEAAFYRCWVRREACLKACGRGFSLPAGSLELSPLKDNAAVLSACCNQQCWHILDIDVPHGYCAALAVAVCDPAQPLPVVVQAAHRLSFPR